MVNDAPEFAKFWAVWDAVSDGSKAHNIDRRKMCKIENCLNEALREKDLKFLLGAECIWVARDERKGRLLVRYRAVKLEKGKLAFKAGVLGHIKDFGTGAVNINKAMKQIVERVAQPRRPGGAILIGL